MSQPFDAPRCDTRIGSIAVVLVLMLALAVRGAAEPPRIAHGPARADGRLLVAFDGMPCGAAFQRDGKIVVVGTRRKAFGLTRYLSSGRVDRSFGRDGDALTSFGTDRPAGACAVVVTRDGYIIVAGTASLLKHPHWVPRGAHKDRVYSSDLVLARYAPDGRLDRSFGARGRVVTDVRTYDFAADVALQPDGKIVVADGAGGIVRYTSRGRLDPTFGTRGKVLTGSGLEVRRVALQSGGMIVVAGGAELGGTGVFGVARYTTSGLLDRRFGEAGIVRTGVGRGDDYESTIWAIAVQKDDAIVAAGYGEPGTTFALARYDEQGRLDQRFGSGGKVVTAFGPISSMADAETLAVQPNGEIVAGGTYRYPDRFALARYQTNGRLDQHFGTRGKVLVTFRPRNMTYSAFAVSVDNGGRIVLVGAVGKQVALARYKGNGHADLTFGQP